MHAVSIFPGEPRGRRSGPGLHPAAGAAAFPHGRAGRGSPPAGRKRPGAAERPAQPTPGVGRLRRPPVGTPTQHVTASGEGGGAGQAGWLF